MILLYPVLYILRDHMNIYENDPAKYRELSKPFPNAKAAGNAVQAFWDEVQALREKHKIPDLLVVIAVNGLCEDGLAEGRVMLTVSCGAAMMEESLAAFALGEASARRQEITAELLARKGARRPK